MREVAVFFAYIAQFLFFQTVHLFMIILKSSDFADQVLYNRIKDSMTIVTQLSNIIMLLGIGRSITKSYNVQLRQKRI